MKKIFKYLSIMLLIGLISACALGCSNEEGTPEASDQDNEEKPTYIVAFEATFPPFESKDEETGEFVGFDIDLIKAIGEEEGFDVELMEMGFDGIVASVKTGNVDLGVSGLTIDEERLESVDFSTPYYHSALGIVVRADDDTIKDVDNLKGKKIAVQIGTTGAKFARTIEDAQVTDYDQVTDAFLELKNGGADAVVNDHPVNLNYIKGHEKDYKTVGDTLESEYYGIAIKKGNTEVLNKINSGLEKLKEKGKYAELYKEWFDVEPPEYLPGEENA
ncbi:MAG TPA: basic amino acid ABC transporter substrate-binding protein [Peptococcaceae bacterium]|nr:basic amino acid ABC transporter substrate-binding protein [Peptococcaceae bacterium]